MKVFTIDQELQLEIHKSIGAFLAQSGPSGWCNENYLSTATTQDLRERYTEPFTRSMIVHTDNQIKAHNLLHSEFKRL